jgi:hypothetical protein
MIRYNIYATLLDGFQNFLDSSEIYQEYWGFSENPAKTEEGFEKEQYQSLIDRINRKPFDSEAASKGTAFNELIDKAIADPARLQAVIDRGQEIIPYPFQKRDAEIGDCYDFKFATTLVKNLADYFKGAISQVHTEGILETKYGKVLLYGYIDELMPTSCHDIKTTGKYKAGKFRKGWQKIVYPYCLNQQGNCINDFEYNVAVFTKDSFTTYDEYYSYVAERDIKLLTEHVELLIEFLENNRNLITDKKIFNEN